VREQGLGGTVQWVNPVVRAVVVATAAAAAAVSATAAANAVNAVFRTTFRREPPVVGSSQKTHPRLFREKGTQGP